MLLLLLLQLLRLQGELLIHFPWFNLKDRRVGSVVVRWKKRYCGPNNERTFPDCCFHSRVLPAVSNHLIQLFHFLFVFAGPGGVLSVDGGGQLVQLMENDVGIIQIETCETISNHVCGRPKDSQELMLYNVCINTSRGRQIQSLMWGRGDTKIKYRSHTPKYPSHSLSPCLVPKL